MTWELISIIVTAIIVFLIYYGRIKSKNGQSSFLFSQSFLAKTDDLIFNLMMFVYKLYSLMIDNMHTFLKMVPHKIADIVHKISNAIAAKSHYWIEKFKSKQDGDGK